MVKLFLVLTGQITALALDWKAENEPGYAVLVASAILTWLIIRVIVIVEKIILKKNGLIN